VDSVRDEWRALTSVARVPNLKLGVIMTCHNRKAKTLACLSALFESELPQQTTLHVFLVDDGSLDGTSEAIASDFPTVKIVHGNGSLYWNGGMRTAADVALAHGVDAMLWLNDDTLIFRTALTTLFETSRAIAQIIGKEAIIVGAVCDPVTGSLTYGGLNRLSRWRRTTFSLLPCSEVAVECETLNGNCALIPASVFREIGNLEPRFSHGLGDLDYGLRARKAGFEVWVAPGFVGTCSRNVPAGTFSDGSLSLSNRLRRMLGPKGLPLKPWLVFTRRHCGPLWFFYWLFPYARLVLSAARLVKFRDSTKMRDDYSGKKPS